MVGLLSHQLLQRGNAKAGRAARVSHVLALDLAVHEVLVVDRLLAPSQDLREGGSEGPSRTGEQHSAHCHVWGEKANQRPLPDVGPAVTRTVSIIGVLTLQSSAMLRSTARPCGRSSVM